jgi:hypothetical protein
MPVNVAALPGDARLDLDGSVVTFRPVPKLRAVLACSTLLLGACALPAALEDPKIQASPYLALYTLKGKTRMQSVDQGTGSIVDNNDVHLREFGGEHYDEDVGVRFDVGDGFSTFRFDYLMLDQNTSQKGTLSDDWGTMQQGDQAHLRTRMNEIRLGYVNEIWREKFGERERQVDLRLGVGAMMGIRQLKMEAREDQAGRTQTVRSSDQGSFGPAVRARASYRGWYVDGEYAISPDNWSLGGEFDGTQQDLEVRLGYQIPMQDVAVFFGYRWSQFEIKGNEGGLNHREDLTLDGFQFGVVITL